MPPRATPRDKRGEATRERPAPANSRERSGRRAGERGAGGRRGAPKRAKCPESGAERGSLPREGEAGARATRGRQARAAERPEGARAPAGMRAKRAHKGWHERAEGAPTGHRPREGEHAAGWSWQDASDGQGLPARCREAGGRATFSQPASAVRSGVIPLRAAPMSRRGVAAAALRSRGVRPSARTPAPLAPGHARTLDHAACSVSGGVTHHAPRQ